MVNDKRDGAGGVVDGVADELPPGSVGNETNLFIDDVMALCAARGLAHRAGTELIDAIRATLLQARGQSAAVVIDRIIETIDRLQPATFTRLESLTIVEMIVRASLAKPAKK